MVLAAIRAAQHKGGEPEHGEPGAHARNAYSVDFLDLHHSKFAARLSAAFSASNVIATANQREQTISLAASRS
jgi:hypothetical protein